MAKQKLTFPTLCPLWDKVLTTGKINRKLRMDEVGTCLVGEARLFNTPKVFGCEKCLRLSVAFYSIAPGVHRVKVKNADEFFELKVELVKHVLKEHGDEHA